MELIMSESSEDKSKRTFINNMKNNVWKHQFTVFFNNHGESLNIIEHMKQVKIQLRKDFQDSAILYRVCHRDHTAKNNYIEDVEDGTKALMPYFTFFTSKTIKLGEIKISVRKVLKLNIYFLSRPIDEERVSSYINSVKRGKPHNLKNNLGIENVNRQGIINKNKLIPIDKLSTPPAYAEETKPRTGRPEKIIEKLK
jgi:hypothetical protein